METRLSAWPCLYDLIDEENENGIQASFTADSLEEWSNWYRLCGLVCPSECVGRNESKKCSQHDCLNTINIQSVHRITLYKGKESINLGEIVPRAIEKARQEAI